MSSIFHSDECVISVYSICLVYSLKIKHQNHFSSADDHDDTEMVSWVVQLVRPPSTSLLPPTQSISLFCACAVAR